MKTRLRGRPFPVAKLHQLYRLVRESNTQPLTGTSRPARLVPATDLGITFIGHSSFLLQIGGRNVLIDPVFSTRLVVLRRQRRPGLIAEELPPIDIVFLTHAHMDHLDLSSLRRVIRSTRRQTGKTPEVVVPNGVEDLVARLGFSQIHGLSWWQQTDVLGLTVTMTPCQHWGARMFRDTHRGYGGYVIQNRDHSVYHSGDTAYFPGFREIGARLHPRIALLPVGAYYPDTYRTVHTSPEEAVQAFRDLGTANLMIPMHYGTFRLGREPMDEPLQRLQAETTRLNMNGQLKILEEGETLHLFPKNRIP